MNAEENHAIKLIEPFVHFAQDNGLNASDAVFFGFWAHRETMLVTSRDAAFADAFSRIVYAGVRGDAVDPAWEETLKARTLAAKRFVCTGEPMTA